MYRKQLKMGFRIVKSLHTTLKQTITWLD